MKRFLSTQERENLKAQHRLERDKRICDRIKAVLLSDDGWDFKEIAHVLLLSEDAIQEHIYEYLNLNKLKPENGGSLGKLSIEQSNILSQHLQKHTYLYTKDIVAYVETIFRDHKEIIQTILYKKGSRKLFGNYGIYRNIFTIYQ